MNIDQILNDKGREVISVKADCSLEEASRILDQKRIGAVVALGVAGDIIGVLSERDIVRQVARQGRNALQMQVGDAMTREVITIESAMKVEDAMQLMTDRRVRHLPVFRNERLVGVVSIGDLVKWKIADAEAEAEAMKSYLSTQY